MSLPLIFYEKNHEKRRFSLVFGVRFVAVIRVFAR